MKKINLLFLILSCIFLDFQAEAQNSRREDYWTIGVQLNALNYFGDLNPLSQRISTELSFTRPNFGIEATRKIGAHFHLKGSFSYGRLRGDDYVAADPGKDESVARYGRNLHFRNDIFELSFMAIFEIFPSRGRFYRRRYFSPYLFAGIAGFYHNPQAKVPLDYTGSDATPGDWVNLRPLSTEGQGLTKNRAGGEYNSKYSLIQPAIPLGAGVRFRISDRLDLGFEMGFRLLFFDHIDDVGGLSPDMFDLLDQVGPLAVALSDRSAETRAAVSGENRNLEDIVGIVGNPTNRYGIIGDPTSFQELPATDGQTFQHLPSYGNLGDKRGNTPKENDMYIITGFRLNYILTTRRYPRLPGGRRRY